MKLELELIITEADLVRMQLAVDEVLSEREARNGDSDNENPDKEKSA